MNNFANPNTVHKPLGKYHHTVRVPGNSDLLAIAGQVGMDRTGKIASGVRAQTEQVFRNILACLEANGMDRRDMVKLTAYLTDARYTEDYRAGRTAVLGPETEPASTLVIVSGLASPEYLVEVEAWAAKSR